MSLIIIHKVICIKVPTQMPDCVVLPNSRSEQLSHNHDVHIVHKCFNCVNLESQLKETLMELSS